ncbi:MAG: sulfite exporter TauE/SafE family protein [Oscillospiraceae bacterium]|jgi:uncharacterized membrane protein YfcA|nr:sulfite exporter TauE/SafE family protein [Oscillospiraceae bacterium]
MKLKKILSALGVGLINGLLGAGGGMIAVPALEKNGLEPNKAHASSIAVILPISVLSAGLYLWRGQVELADSLSYIPGGIIGALLGGWLLPKIPAEILKRIFGVFALWAGVRILFFK